MTTLRPVFVFFFNDPAPTEIYTLSLHDALPICTCGPPPLCDSTRGCATSAGERHDALPIQKASDPQTSVPAATTLVQKAQRGARQSGVRHPRQTRREAAAPAGSETAADGG